VNEEGNVVEPVPEEEQSLVEVRFDICGTDPELNIPVDQGKASDAFKPFLCFEKLYFTLLMLCCIW
jgi:hypothetical protein